MEWVETTGTSLDKAKESALDQLGVDESEAEFEVLEEPKAGLFGRVRGEARVRARVRPVAPRPKVERRDRRRKAKGDDETTTEAAPRKAAAKPRKAAAKAPKPAVDDDAEAAPAPARAARTRRPAAGSSSTNATESNPARSEDKDEAMTEVVTLERQGEIVEEFLDGLLEAFDLDGDVEKVMIDDEMLELQVAGDDLGLLIGPKGQTLTSLQELARTVVQRQSQGSSQGRFRLDVSGYRQRRREALARFATQVAADVQEKGVAQALEPMGAADRKVVHDTINEIDGVSTLSEGDEPSRRVVITPA